ncbi:MAG: Zn-dependent hydrolase [Rhodospirillales bacterium]|nr:Zn-dependent hydrolase [Rhodospirillales bacterium]
MGLSVDQDRLWRTIEGLAAITDPNRPYTRRSFSALHVKGRNWIRGQFEEAGLALSLDAAANLTGHRQGADSGLGAIVVGSHSDSVPDGGRFDGIAGVLAGLEVARALRDNGVELRHPFQVVDFLAEEPSAYGMSCVGSRALAGALTAEHLGVQEPGGETLAEGINRMGGDAAKLTGPLRSPGEIAAYVEVHIEQGPVLESRKIPAGIVTAIVGISRTNIYFTGRADHSGNTPMTMRRDALLGASKLVVLAEEEARALNSDEDYFVGTVGQLDVEPNASNIVPGRVSMCLEYRSNSTPARAGFINAMKRHGERIAKDVDLEIRFEPVSDAEPAVCDDRVRAAIRAACEKSGHGCIDMPSGAGHDAMHVARLAPMGMIFIPCQAGRSHCPEEWVSPEDLAAGVNVLYETILALDSKLD